MNHPHPLAVAPFPVEGEHPAGYVRRLAAANGLDSLRQLRALHDVAPPSPLSGPEAWRRLAAATGLPPSRFDVLRWPRVGRTREVWLAVMGRAVRQRHLDLDHLKRCPRCLDEEGIFRAEWSLRHVTACPKHRVLLSDACLLCRWPISAGERTDVWHCGPCGTHFADGDAEPAPAEQVALSHAMISAMRDGVPPHFATLDPQFLTLPIGDMAAVVDFLSRLALAADAPGRTADRRRAPPPRPFEAREQSRRAARLLLDWPNALRDLLADLDPAGEGRTRVGSSARQFAGSAGDVLARPPLTPSGSPIAFVAEAVEAVLGDVTGHRRRQRATSSRSRSGARVAAAAAAVPISHADAMGRLEGRRDGRLARWWIDAGLLAEVRPTPDRAVLSTDEVSMLAESVRFVADAEPRPDPVDVAWIDRSVTCGHEYDKSDFLLDLLDGRIGAWVAATDREGLAALRFSRTSVLRRAAMGRIRAWIAADAHVAMSRFRQAAARIWDEDALPRSAEARRLAATGALRFSFYDPPGDGRRQHRWHAGDLVTEIQRRTGVVELDA